MAGLGRAALMGVAKPGRLAVSFINGIPPEPRLWPRPTGEERRTPGAWLRPSAWVLELQGRPAERDDAAAGLRDAVVVLTEDGDAQLAAR